LRIVSKLIVAATAAATIAAMAAGPALADPPTGTTPKPADVVGVGSDTIQFVFDQFSHDFNKGLSSSKPHLYSFDATNPKTGAIGDTVVLKGTKSDHKTCALARPDGSSQGISALETSNKTISGHPCIDFARSSRARSGDPNTVSFVNLAGDAVGYATEQAAGGGKSNVPSNLTTAELNAIYSCKVKNWDKLKGGGNGKPEIFIPQSGSGTRSFFLSAIGGPTFVPGPCANDLPTKAVPTGTLEENEGVNPAFAKNPQNVIFPYSIGKWLAETFHSASCGTNAQCFKNPTKCTPKKGQNLFGCNTHGSMQLQEVNGTKPTSPFPPTAKSIINTGFSATFQRILFEVVSNPDTTGFGIPTYLQPFFGPTGWTCTNKTAQTDLKDYGFRLLPTGTASGDCGFAS
jgi:ABC-type phosphate transport system substrate-binding protein